MPADKTPPNETRARLARDPAYRKELGRQMESDSRVMGKRAGLPSRERAEEDRSYGSSQRFGKDGTPNPRYVDRSPKPFAPGPVPKWRDEPARKVGGIPGGSALAHRLTRKAPARGPKRSSR